MAAEVRTSAGRLRARLAENPGVLRLLLTEAIYKAQVDYTCDLLDVVDEHTDWSTAMKITDAIYERMRSTAAADAEQRLANQAWIYEQVRSRGPDLRT